MRLTIRNKLIAGFGAIVALMLLSTGIVSLRLGAVVTRQEQIKDVFVPASMNAGIAASALSGTAADLRGYILFGSDPAEAAQAKEDRAANWEVAGAALTQLQQLSPRLSSEEQQQIEAIAAMTAEYHATQDKIEDLATGHGGDALGQAFDLLKSDAAPRQRALAKNLKAFLENQQQSTNREVAALTATSRNTQALEWIVTLLSLIHI